MTKKKESLSWWNDKTHILSIAMVAIVAVFSLVLMTTNSNRVGEAYVSSSDFITTPANTIPSEGGGGGSGVSYLTKQDVLDMLQACTVSVHGVGYGDPPVQSSCKYVCEQEGKSCVAAATMEERPDPHQYLTNPVSCHSMETSSGFMLALYCTCCAP